MSKTKASRLSPAQLHYAIAKAAYDEACAAATAEYPADPPADCSDSVFDAWNEQIEDIDAKHKIDSLQTALMDAEDALVTWSIKSTKRIATKAQQANLEDLRVRGMMSLKVRAKLVRLAMRLAA